MTETRPLPDDSDLTIQLEALRDRGLDELADLVVELVRGERARRQGRAIGWPFTNPSHGPPTFRGVLDSERPRLEAALRAFAVDPAPKFFGLDVAFSRMGGGNFPDLDWIHLDMRASHRGSQFGSRLRIDARRLSAVPPDDGVAWVVDRMVDCQRLLEERMRRTPTGILGVR
jgi:hypothetical protein